MNEELLGRIQSFLRFLYTSYSFGNKDEFEGVIETAEVLDAEIDGISRSHEDGDEEE